MMQERFARIVHAVHGTRGILLSTGALLAWLLLEPGVPTDVGPFVVVPLSLLLLSGLATLPREGVAVQLRGRALTSHPQGAHVLRRRAWWLLLLLVLLVPRVFLAFYGVPHLSPHAGLLSLRAMQTLSALHAAAIVVVCAVYLRSSRLEGDAPVRRPIELRDGSGQHLARQGLQVALAVLFVVWLWTLRGFWQPFSLFQFPPGFSSLASARATASLAVALAPPGMLLCALGGHLEHLWGMWRHDLLRPRRADALWTLALAAGVVLAVWLHLRNLLWVARYQQAGIV